MKLCEKYMQDSTKNTENSSCKKEQMIHTLHSNFNQKLEFLSREEVEIIQQFLDMTEILNKPRCKEILIEKYNTISECIHSFKIKIIDFKSLVKELIKFIISSEFELIIKKKFQKFEEFKYSLMEMQIIDFTSLEMQGIAEELWQTSNYSNIEIQILQDVNENLLIKNEESEESKGSEKSEEKEENDELDLACDEISDDDIDENDDKDEAHSQLPNSPSNFQKLTEIKNFNSSIEFVITEIYQKKLLSDAVKNFAFDLIKQKKKEFLQIYNCFLLSGDDQDFAESLNIFYQVYNFTNN